MAKTVKKSAKSADKKVKMSKVGQAITRDNGRPVIIAAIGLSLVASLASLGYCIWDYVDDRGTTVAYVNPYSNNATFAEASIADVVDQVAPAVVSIVAEVQTSNFFGQSQTSNASGTGMIVTSDGYIITNKHVIDGGSSYKVVLNDGTSYDDVELVGTDPLSDVAFLKIKNASDLPIVTLGDSKTLKPGQQVVAIGNALGEFQNTVTSGIISGTGRTITATGGNSMSSESLNDMIQTDAAINTGNSGGPLVNAAGEVIGINTATSLDADGIAFAIPISSVKGMLKNILENNSTDRAYLGVYYIVITPEVAETYNLPVNSGAYVYAPSLYSAVIKDSPAAAAGIQDKDIITKINGLEVGKFGSVASLIGEYVPGDKIKITILRDGKEQDIDFTVGKYQAQ